MQDRYQKVVKCHVFVNKPSDFYNLQNPFNKSKEASNKSLQKNIIKKIIKRNTNNELGIVLFNFARFSTRGVVPPM